MSRCSFALVTANIKNGHISGCDAVVICQVCSIGDKEASEKFGT